MTNRWQNPNYTTAEPWVETPECVEEYAVSPGCDPFDPRDIWALQREFGIAKAVMVGWWEEEDAGGGSSLLPVRSNVSEVKVTTYVRGGESALIILANFGHKAEEVTLEFNWTRLGFKGEDGLKLRVPELRVPVQPAGSVAVNEGGVSQPIKVPALRRGAIDSTEGVILLLEKSGQFIKF
jgi:hypothetical protein